MEASATHTPGTERRRRVRTDGNQTLADVARLACGDARLAGLLHDLNQELPLAGRLRAGTEVVCPMRSEAQAFARKMDFAIGIVEGGPSGTAARRLWAAHTADARPARRANASTLAGELLASGVAPAEAGPRVARRCGAGEVAALARHQDPQLRAVGDAAELFLWLPLAKRSISAIRSALQATARPGGLRNVLEALVRSAVDCHGVLEDAMVAPALSAALAAEAASVCRQLARARELMSLERGARDAALQGGDRVLAALVGALADGVEPVAGDRLTALGLTAEDVALRAHVEQLDALMARAEAGLARTPRAVRALAAGGEAGNLPRPWPLVVRMVRRLGARLDVLAPAVRDDGLGGLVPKKGARVSSEGCAVRLTVAELQARAASCARADDEGDALAVRLTPAVLELFGLAQPGVALDGGHAAVRRARRRSAFEQALAARGDVTPAGTAALVTELLERAREAGNVAAARLRPAHLQAATAVAGALPAALSVHRRQVSELGRALVVAAMALDRAIAPVMLRPTGREALVRDAVRHAGRVLSAAACRITAGC